MIIDLWMFDFGILKAVQIQMCLSTPRLEFANYLWQSLAGMQAPGPNFFDPGLLYCDAQGHLHLTLDAEIGRCSGLMTQQAFLFGCFEIDLIAEFNDWPGSAVFGFFAYPDPLHALDGSHEIDIEISRWGQSHGPCLHYSIWPETPETPGLPQTQSLDGSLNGSHTRHRFVWTPDYFEFTSFHGHSDQVLLARHRLANTRQQNRPMHLYLNLWWFQGQYQDAQTIQATVTRFAYQPWRN